MSYHLGQTNQDIATLAPQPRWPSVLPLPTGWQFAATDAEGQRMAAQGISYSNGAIEPIPGKQPFWPTDAGGLPAGWRWLPSAVERSYVVPPKTMEIELIPGTRVGQQAAILTPPAGTVAPSTTPSWLLPVGAVVVLYLILR